MNDNLPIRLNCQGIFEADDPASTSLIERVEAWMNFTAMFLDWFSDESKIVKCQLRLLPQEQYLSQVQLKKDDWQSESNTNIKAHYQHQTAIKQSQLLVMLTNDEIDEAMRSPESLEPMLKLKLSHCINIIAEHYQLPCFDVSP